MNVFLLWPSRQLCDVLCGVCWKKKKKRGREKDLIYKSRNLPTYIGVQDIYLIQCGAYNYECISSLAFKTTVNNTQREKTSLLMVFLSDCISYGRSQPIGQNHRYATSCTVVNSSQVSQGKLNDERVLMA
jgi:hypothetical protein